MKVIRKWRSTIWSIPVGLQLSVIYALLLAVTLTALGAVLYNRLDGFLVSNTAERLQRPIEQLLSRPTGFDGGRPDFGHSMSGTPQTGAERFLFGLIRGLSGPDVSVAVISADGDIIGSTQTIVNDSSPQVPTLAAGWQVAVADKPNTQWVLPSGTDGRQLVLVTPLPLQAIVNGQGTRLYLEQATSLDAADAVLNQLRIYLALGILVGTVLGVLAGLLLTRAVLRPLDHMVGTAEAIANGNISRRLHMPGGRNEIARLGAAFDHMVDRLAATLEAQRRFVADASHELRTPLTSLQGLSEILLMGADRGDGHTVQRMTRSMHGELGRMNRLVNDLLTLSRLDSSAQGSPVPVDIGKLAADVAVQMAPVADAKDVHIVPVCTTAAYALAEPDKLKQVVLNLVDNAIRYSPQGAEVTLWVGRDPSTGQVRLEVRDHGAGIDPDDLPHIFDRFYRGDPSRARATGNSGLGLAIARAIVQTYGGTITAQSAPGAGATFVVTLPSVEFVNQPELVAAQKA